MAALAHQNRVPLARCVEVPHITTRSWSIDESYRYCAQLARSHYENFPVGSWLIPKHLRKHFHSIYAFARTADDFADEKYAEGHTEDERLDCLSEWQGMLRDCYAGQSKHPIFVALAETAMRFDLPFKLLNDLLSAFSQDVTTRRYSSFDDLLDYCRRSANPIGRLILLLFGYKDEELHRRSDCICTGLQLTNHWQDVKIDLDKDRIYLPIEDLSRFGVTVEDLKKQRLTERFRNLMSFEVQRVRDLFDRGKPLCISVSGRLSLELRAVWLGGSLILDRIERNRYDVFSRRPVISGGGKVRVLASIFNKRRFMSQ